jgi:hypothetical protein
VALKQLAEGIRIAGYVPPQQLSVRGAVVLPRWRLRGWSSLRWQGVAVGLLIARIRRYLPPASGPGQRQPQCAAWRCPVLITSSWQTRSQRL